MKEAENGEKAENYLVISPLCRCCSKKNYKEKSRSILNGSSQFSIS